MARAVAGASQTANSRRLILRAAPRAFAARGCDRASTREIAAEAGVAHGLLPCDFGSRRRRWQAAVDLAFEELRRGLDAVHVASARLVERIPLGPSPEENTR